MDRRVFLTSLLAPLVVHATAVAEEAAPTPSQVLGPYYPSPSLRARLYPPDLGPDLTRVGERQAQGRRLWLRGTLRDRAGAPVDGARMELWQTCHRGRYLHPADDWGSEIPPDPGFAYFGSTRSGPDGRWEALTVLPRRYPSGGQREWWRPPHLHLRVWTHGRSRLVTQLYFDEPGHPDNDWEHRAAQEVDRVLGKVPPERRAALVLRLAPLRAAPTAFPDAADGRPWGPAVQGEIALVLPS